MTVGEFSKRKAGACGKVREGFTDSCGAHTGKEVGEMQEECWEGERAEMKVPAGEKQAAWLLCGKGKEDKRILAYGT